MKKRILIQILLLVVATFAAKANPVDMRTAREAAMKFVNANARTPIRGMDDLQLVTTYCIDRGDAAFHIFNTPNGFVIVSANDCAKPILGYSDEGRFDENDIPVQLQDYLQDFVEQIRYGIEKHIEVDEATARQWELVLTIGCPIEQKSNTVVEPLLTDTWNQKCYYNNLCPEDPNGYCGHVVTGCVATSFAQIMHYWGYPVTGRGSHTYKPARYPQQTANFGATTYDWVNMPDSLTSSSTSTQIEAVATLIWHCGVAVNMKYAVNGSSAYSSDIPNAIKDYFGYSDELTMISRNNYSDENWLTRMKDCLDMGYPIHYNAQDANGEGAHAFVCDGYDANDLLHFNWGWGGSANGYFSISAMNPGSYEFTIRNGAIVNIHPDCTPGTTYQVSVTANPSNGGTVNGSGTFDCAEVCTLRSTTSEGYVFDYWTKDGEVVSCLSTCELFVTDTAEYLANFRQVNDILIGEATFANSFLPTYNYQSLSEQIYTAEEIGMEAGEISSVSFFNTSYSNTRQFSVYMANTAKTAFETPTDWISVEESDLVFSGDVTLASKEWTTIYFNTPFNYDGTSSIALIIDDNENTYNTSTKCRTFSTNENQALFINGSATNYNPCNSAGYMGTLMSEKNQIILGIPSYEYTVTVIASPEEGGVVSGGGDMYYYGQPVPISATANEGYVLDKWTRNDEVISCFSSECVRATETAECVANFQQVDGIAIGDATFANTSLPTCYYQSLSEQIYTAEEIGMEAGEISSVAFFNTGLISNCNFSIYLVNTAKTAFESPSDWISVEEADLVFCGNVTLASKEWTTIYFNTPFNYDGTSNIALIIDDNKNGSSTGIKCRTFHTDESQALCINGYGTNYDPYNPAGYTGTLMSEKNQIILGIPSYDYTVTLAASPEEGGTVSGGGDLYYYGQPIPISATANEGYVLDNWTKDNEVVSCFSSDYVSVTETTEYVANFQQVDGIAIGDAIYASSYLPSSVLYYSLTQQIYTADEMGNEACSINSISFFNTSNSTRTQTVSIFMTNTNKAVFEDLTDWIAVTEEDLVFSGSFTMAPMNWATIYFDKPFVYDGVSNVALVMDNNNGKPTGSALCRTFDADGYQSIVVNSTTINYDPYNPSSYIGALLTEKNQIILGIETCAPQVQQTMEIEAGMNWFSTNLDITLEDLKSAIAGAVGDEGTATILSHDGALILRNGQWRGSGIPSLDVRQMYEIHTSMTCEITLVGTLVNPSEYEITITPDNNWIGFLPSEGMTLNEAFGAFPVDGDMVKSRNNSSVYRNGQWRGQLNGLQPGNGYIYNSAATGNRTFTFPTSAK